MNHRQKIEDPLARYRERGSQRSHVMRQCWIALTLCAVVLAAATSRAAAPTAANPGTTSIAGVLGAPSSAGQSSAPRSVGPSTGLLDPMEAFKPLVRRTSPTTLEVKFEIAPRYYLYRDRLKLELIEDAPSLRAPNPSASKSNADGKIAAGEGKGRGHAASARKLAMSMPTGKMIDDPTFGRVEVYEQSLVATADIKPDKDRRGAVKLAVLSQGCAAEGVCFPPQRFEFSFPPWRPVTGAQEAGAPWISPSTADTLGFGRRSASPR